MTKIPKPTTLSNQSILSIVFLSVNASVGAAQATDDPPIQVTIRVMSDLRAEYVSQLAKQVSDVANATVKTMVQKEHSIDVHVVGSKKVAMTDVQPIINVLKRQYVDSIFIELEREKTNPRQATARIIHQVFTGNNNTTFEFQQGGKLAIATVKVYRDHCVGGMDVVYRLIAGGDYKLPGRRDAVKELIEFLGDSGWKIVSETKSENEDWVPTTIRTLKLTRR